MTTQTKYTSLDGKIVSKIQFDEEWNEYQVKVWIEKKFQKLATYHTDDLDDAVGTAKKLVNLI